MEQVLRYSNASSLMKYSIGTTKSKLKFDFMLNAFKKRNSSSRLLKSDKKFSSFKIQSHSILKDIKYNRKELRKEDISFIEKKELTPSPIKSSLIIDTSPCPRLRFRTKLPILKRFNESTDIMNKQDKSDQITNSLKETCSANQETQTDQSFINFPKNLLSTKRPLEGKNLIENFQIFPQTPAPRFQLKKMQSQKKTKRKLKEFILNLS